MSTTRNADFATMLNQYLPLKLLKEEMIKRDYFLKNLDRQEDWLSGDLIVPFRGSQASTVKLGSLTASADINQSKYVRGVKSGQPELWGSLVFEEKDLRQHGKISEQNFLKLLPDEIESFLGFVKQALSLSFTNGSSFAKATTDGLVGGTATVDRVERFEVGQGIMIDDDNSAALKVWVSAVNINTNVVSFATDITLGTPVDISAYTVAQNAKFYFDGADVGANQFTNLRASLLSLANGGSTSLYGVTKTAWPATQAVNVSGADIVASNLLEKIFDAQTRVRNVGKGMPSKIIMSYKHLASALKTIEVAKGAYKQVDSPKAELYGWTEVEVMGVKGMLTLVAIQEMDDDVIYIMDLSAAKIYSNGFFQKRKDPGDGKEYFTERLTTGYRYICDISFQGDLILQRPSRCGIIHSISY